MRKFFKVSADHVSPNYRFVDHDVRVSQCRYDETYYADAAKLGCGKNYRSVCDAIYGLFQDHACYNIRITEVKIPD